MTERNEAQQQAIAEWVKLGLSPESVEESFSQFEAEARTRVYAPFTLAQVHRLRMRQVTEHLHPYTCGNDSRHGRLLATTGQAGWECLECDYTQNWAHGADAGDPR